MRTRAGSITEQREIAQIMRDSGQHLQRLIEDLLEFGKTQVPRSRSAATRDGARWMKSCAAHSTATASVSAAKGSLIDRPDPAASVRGDQDQLRILVDNLLSNAVKYTPAHGKIPVSSRGAMAPRSRWRLPTMARASIPTNASGFSSPSTRAARRTRDTCKAPGSGSRSPANMRRPMMEPSTSPTLRWGRARACACAFASRRRPECSGRASSLLARARLGVAACHSNPPPPAGNTTCGGAVPRSCSGSLRLRA